MKLRLEPVERSADIVDFSAAVIVLSMAQSCTAEIEAQHRKSEAIKRLHRMEHNLVVQRSSKQRVRMADNCCVRRILRAGVEQSLKASCRAFQEQRSNRRVGGDHLSRLHKINVGLRMLEVGRQASGVRRQAKSYFEFLRPKARAVGSSLRSDVRGLWRRARSLTPDLLFSLPWMRSHLRGS